MSKKTIVTELPGGYFLIEGVTLSYPHLAAPQKSDDGPDKYSAAFIIDSEAQDYTPLLKAVLETGKEKFGPDAAKKMKAGGPLRNPLRDGEFKYGEGTVFFNARSSRQPSLVTTVPDPKTGKPMRVAQDDILDVFYPGAIVNVVISVYAYSRPENKGVSFGIEGVQKVADGERLDNRVAVVDVFAADPEALVGMETDEDIVGVSAEEANADLDEEDELSGLLG